MYSVPFVEISATPLERGEREATGGERQRRNLERRKRRAAPEPQQPQIENEHGAEQRRDAEDVEEIDDAVGPDAGRAHGLPKGRALEPDEQHFQART